jgi:hypothetical protein
MLVTANGQDYIFKFSCRVFEHYRHNERCYNYKPAYVAEKPFEDTCVVKYVGLNWNTQLPCRYY